jgi:signal transduction histidine kinase
MLVLAYRQAAPSQTLGVPGELEEFVAAVSCELSHTVLERGETIANYEDVRVTKDGRRVPILSSLSAVRDESNVIVGVMGIAKDLSAHKALDEQSRILTRLEERELIAMDLHDNTMQALYGAVFAIDAMVRTLDANEAVVPGLRQITNQVNAAILDLLRYIYDLQREDATAHGRLTARLAGFAAEVRAHSLV